MVSGICSKLDVLNLDVALHAGPAANVILHQVILLPTCGVHQWGEDHLYLVTTIKGCRGMELGVILRVQAESAATLSHTLSFRAPYLVLFLCKQPC